MPSPTNARTLNRRSAVRLGGGGLAAALATHGLPSAEAQTLTILEANKALIHRVFEEAVNGDNDAVVAELYGPEFVDPALAARFLPRPAGMPLPIDAFHTMLPAVYATVEGLIAEGDLVAARVTWRGSHPPAGTHVVGRTMHLFRIADGQISEEWSAGWEWLAQCGYRSVPRPALPFAGE